MPNKLSQFWQELKRRNVSRVLTVYIAVAFMILELVDMISDPFGLPDWSMKVAFFILIAGLIIAVIVSWLYDIHPKGGIVKTEPAHEAKMEDIPPSSNRWKIASYISFVVIVGLIVLNIIPRAGNKEVLDKSIAVLPFQNDSPDEEKMYFINGTMDAILDNLCKIADLRVVSRNSVEQYRDNPKPTPVVAEEMNVSYVLGGSGQKIGNRVLLIVQLIDGKTDQHLWSKQYDREIEKVEDLIDIQIEIATLVAGEIEAIITPQEKELIEKIPTTSLTAYDFYQRGREEIENDNYDRAQQLFLEAIENDSTFAQAYVGLAMVYWGKRYWETIFQEDFLDSVLILAEIALSMDDRLSDAYMIRGHYYQTKNEPDKAIEDVKRAISYNPNNGLAFISGGVIYANNNDLLKSIQYYHKALDLCRGDQLPEMLDNVGWAYLQNGFIDKSKFYYSEAYRLTGDLFQYYDRLAMCEFVSENFSDAIEYLKKEFALDSTNNDFHLWFGEYYMMNGDYVQSFKHYRKWLEGDLSLSQEAVFGMHRIGWAYWMNGLKEEGKKYLKQQIDYINKMIDLGHIVGVDYRYYYDLAAVYAFIGEKNKALRNLMRLKGAPTGNRWMIMYFKHDPLFDSIRDEPEFKLILDEAEAKYQAEHERVRQWLEENDML